MLKKLITVVLILIITFVLTVFTQVGGVVFLIALLFHRFIKRKLSNRWLRYTASLFSFLTLYLMAVFIFVPILAKPFGRVPLPMFERDHVKPVTILTCLLNRNYVRPELKIITMQVAAHMNKQYPGTVLNYLDANFPFVDEFPLWPHLSHDDGRKLDLSFLYTDVSTGEPSSEVPSFIGYGVCEEPKPGEENRPAFCAQQGYWQYSFMSGIVSQSRKAELVFDPSRTKSMINNFVRQSGIGKILIEPHLKSRLRLTSRKIRLHGCQAVRHDDHIHIQLR